ncbi:PAS domain-containing protein [Rhodoferax sp. GW822-FHT02A01]|uniref:PAS domain-containing protein n=1 Tax=Rhodoferax sp. GW822-FHT02A01 TaxID=3141537 RepID=UPI00315D39E0
MIPRDKKPTPGDSSRSTKSPSDQLIPQESEIDERDLLRALLENSPDHIYFKDTLSRFIKCSRAQALEFGEQSPDDLIGKTDFDIFSKDHATPAFEDEQEIIRTGQPIVGKVEKETWQDGRQETWAWTTKMPLRNKDGKIVGTFGISKDITEFKNTEAELAYQRDLFSILMDNTPDSIFFKDTQSRFVKISRSEVNNLLRLATSRYLAARTGDEANALPVHLTSAEEFEKYVIGKTDADIYGTERAAEFGNDEAEILRTGISIVEKSEKTEHPDGRVVWYLTTKGPWRDKSGKIIGTFGTSKNISELKAAHARIEEVQAQLLDSARIAGMAEIAINVLHNVGNVLNSINVSAGLISTQLASSKIIGLERVANLMEENASHLGDFIANDARGKLLPTYFRQLTETLRLEHDAISNELNSLLKNVEHVKQVIATQQSYASSKRMVESTNLIDLIEDALRMNSVSPSHLKTEVVREYSELPAYALDRHRVLQILVNLIANARQALSADGVVHPTMTLRTYMEEGKGRLVLHIQVRDNGEGIAPENLKRVFSHGFTTRPNGHGFGLHSCVVAAQEMGGTLSAQSDGVGKGASFTLSIPIRSSEFEKSGN